MIAKFSAHGSLYTGGIKILIPTTTMIAGGSLMTATGIQKSMEFLSGQPGNLASEIQKYQAIKQQSRKLGPKFFEGEQEELAFEKAFTKGKIDFKFY